MTTSKPVSNTQLFGFVAFLLTFFAFLGSSISGINSARRETHEKWSTWRQEAQTPAQQEIALYIEKEIRSVGFPCDPQASSDSAPFWGVFKGHDANRQNQLDMIHEHEKTCARALRGQLRVNRGEVADIAFAHSLIARAEAQ